MPPPSIASSTASASTLADVAEQREQGLVILSPKNRRALRRVLYLNSYGGAEIWDCIRRGRMGSHHLWGCLQLVQRGYEVALAEPLTDFYIYRHPLPHDLKYLSFVRSWLGTSGVIYCGHNVLYWLPLLHGLKLLRAPVVSLMFAREPLNWSRAHAGIVALTPAAADHARQLAPHTRVARLGWGCDLNFLSPAEFSGNWFLSCGATNRDHDTLLAAARKTSRPLRIVCRPPSNALGWPRHVSVLSTNWPQPGALDPRDFADEHYGNAIAGLVILKHDPAEQTACGFTEALDMMASGKPIILTRTGALHAELDLEHHECGLLVPPNDPDALAGAMETIAANPAQAAKMGQNARRLCERHYNIDRYAEELHRFFSTL